MDSMKKKIQGVSMLPFGLVAGFAGEKEIRITQLADDGFTFRTAEKIADPDLFRVCFYHYPKLRYEQVKLHPHSYTLKCSAKYEFYYEYTLYMDNVDEMGNETENKTGSGENRENLEYRKYKECREYRNQVQTLLLWYDRYIRLKLTGDENELASAMTAYPENGDVVTAGSFEEQKKRWLKGENQETERASGQFEWAVQLDTPKLYSQYLTQDLPIFMKDYWEQNMLSDHWLSACQPKRLYIGNAFCHLLFPKEDQLFLLLEKALKEGLQVTLTFSYIREFMLESVKTLLNRLENWCEEKGCVLEIQVNDWAVAELLKEKKLLIPVLGILLNKRRKDPRLHYKMETMARMGAENGSRFLEENSLNADFYREYLKEEYRIVRYEWESCGYDMVLPAGKNSLHLPFYQTNTSQYCTLYARCTTGERGKQKLAEHCPGFCQDYTFLYPDHLKMVGRYNSLFALDSRIFQAGLENGTEKENKMGMQKGIEETGIKEMLEKWKAAGVDRMIVDLL